MTSVFVLDNSVRVTADHSKRGRMPIFHVAMQGSPAAMRHPKPSGKSNSGLADAIPQGQEFSSFLATIIYAACV